jgi:antitoxin component of MazEF toxin-antitoxin module
VYNQCSLGEIVTKKLTKQGEKLALVLEKDLLESLGISESTPLDIIAVGDTLTIKPKNHNTKAEKARKERNAQAAHRIIDEYEPVFKKLAKT